MTVWYIAWFSWPQYLSMAKQKKMAGDVFLKRKLWSRDPVIYASSLGPRGQAETKTENIQTKNTIITIINIRIV